MKLSLEKNCDKYQAMFSDYLNKDLKQEEARELEEHLSVCKRCFEEYANFVENWVETEERQLYLVNRPRWGTPVWTLDREKELTEEICVKAVEIEENKKKGIILIKYEPDHERAVLMLQLRIAANLRELGKNVLLISSESEDFLLTKKIDKQKIWYLVIKGGTKFLDLEEFKMKFNANTIFIASGLSNEWSGEEVFLSDFVYAVHSEPKIEDYFRPFITSEVRKDEERILGKKELGKAYFYVSILDVLGILTPLSLLSKLLEKSEDYILQLINEPGRIIHKVDTGRPIKVVTKGEVIAEEVVKKFKKDDVILGYQEIIKIANLDIPEERYVVLKLLQMLIKKGRHSTALKKLILPFKEKVDKTWGKEDTYGILAWGKIFYELGMFEKSEKVFLKGLDKEKRNIFLLNGYARMLGRWAKRRPEKYEDARRHFAYALNIEPENVYVWHSRGKMEEELGHYDEAYDCFEEALKIDKYNIYTIVSLADIELKRQHIDKAERWLKLAIGIEPENLYALHVFGELETSRLNYKKAEEYFDKVLKIDPKNVPTLHALGVMCRNRGHWKKAEKLLNKALEIYPENEYVLQTLGELLGEEGRYDEGVEKFKKVINFDPEHIETLVAWGQLEAKRENYEEAYDLFSRAEKINPDNIRVYGALAEAKLRKSELDEAEELLDVAIDKPGNKVPTWNLFGKLESHRGDMETARRFFNRAYEKAHRLDKIITRNTWVEMELKHGDPGRAEYLVKESFDMDKYNAYTCRVYAKWLEKMGRCEEAENYRQKAEELKDADIEI